MMIGVAAVIVLVAVGNGSKRQVQAAIDALGSNVLVVQAQRRAASGRARGGGRASTLTQKDADGARRTTSTRPTSRARAPVVNASGTTLVAGSTSYQPSSFVGTTPTYATTRDYRDRRPAPSFTTQDVTDARPQGRDRPDRRREPVQPARSPVGPVDPRRRHELHRRRRDRASKGSNGTPGPGRRRARAAHRGPGHAQRLRRASARSPSRRRPRRRWTPRRPR